jgi:SOS-response transcriptional repressor LexA
MRSRKLQALDFIKRYYAQWGYSPSLSEIAAELGVSKKRAHGLVQQLSDDAQIRVVAGKQRGIVLPDRREEISEADVLLRLRQLGWRVAGAGDRLPVGAPSPRPGVTEKGLTILPRLDHDDDPTEVVLRRGD